MDLDKSRREGAALQAEVKKIQEAAKKDNDKAQVDISKRLTRNILHHVATHCSILQYTATHFQKKMLIRRMWSFSQVRHTAPRCNTHTLQHPAPHCKKDAEKVYFVILKA